MSEVSTSGASEVAPVESRPATPGSSPAVSFLSIVVIALFFAPWINFLGGRPSGFDLQKIGDQYALLWCIPAVALVTTILAFQGKHARIMGQLTAATVFLWLFYGFYRFGKELIEALLPGGYLLIGAAVLLFLVAGRQKS